MRWMNWVCGLVVGWMVVAGAEAKVREVPPGQVPELGPGDGLVVIVIDTDSRLSDIRFRKEGRVIHSAAIEEAPAGGTPKLYVLPAGEYEWDRLTSRYGLRYVFLDKPGNRFKVEAGTLNYPGDLIVRGILSDAPSLLFSNRSVQAMDWLDSNYPGLGERLPFRYAGIYQDAFPAFYREAQRAIGKPHSELGYALNPPKPGPLPLPARELWRKERISAADMNPRGDMMIKVLNTDAGTEYHLVELPGRESTLLMKGCCPIDTMGWAGDDVFIVALRQAGSTAAEIHVFRFRKATDGSRAFDHLAQLTLARSVTILPEQPDYILLASFDDDNRLLVHRLDIRDRKGMAKFRFKPGSRVNRGVAGDRMWFADGHGHLRVAISRVGEELAIMHGAGESYREVMRFGLENPFLPISLSFEGDLIYGLSEHGRGQRDLVVFDTTSRTMRTLFSKPGIDVVAPILDGERRPLGAMYYLDGHLVSDYFDQAGSGTTEALQRLFPGKAIAGSDRAGNGGMLAWVRGADDAGALYHVDFPANKATMIEADAPWLANHRFSPTEVLKTTARDGKAIESYLTLPRGSGRWPLVVLSHGGPVGVRDVRGFDREVQFMASLGIAVLQVNFRGSEGFGTSFRDAGIRAYGTSIEDDIDAVLAEVARDPRIDAARMCAVGSSYGGYSALISAIRWPDRYRCVVSIAGLSDMPLFFSASDSGNTERGREVLKRFVGDLDADADALRRNSPVYRFRELKAALMLVHGDDDLRVDYEHTRRMVRMLNIAGTRPTLITIEDGGHGFGRLDEVEAVWNGIAGFLQRHLKLDRKHGETR